MKTLYFIRHAQSEANLQRILASRLPFPLTLEGRAEAASIARQFRKIARIDTIISSPLKRAAQTAEPFGRAFGLPICYDPRICEQELGKFSGMTYDQVKECPDYRHNALDRWDWKPEGGGESYRMIAERISSFLFDLHNRAGDRRILIVTHAVALRLIMASLKNTLPTYPKEFPNNGEILKVLDYRGPGAEHRWESLFLGNSAHYTHNP